jgi:hypothetical protein
MHTNLFDEWWKTREHRLCRQVDEEAAFQHSLDVLELASPFVAEMEDRAKLVPQPPGEEPDTTLFTDDARWREAWKTDAVYDRDPGAPTRIENPLTFLQNLDREERRRILIQYLEERLPQTARASNAHFRTITDASVDFADATLINAAKALMEVRAGVNNEAVAAAAEADVKNELMHRYRRGYGLSRQAYKDFSDFLRKNPDVREAISTDPSVMATLTQHHRTPLAAAFRYEVFTAKELQNMVNRFKADEIERERDTSRARVEVNALRDRMEVMSDRGLHEKVWENIKQMSAKEWIVAVGVIGGYLWWLFKKRENEPGYITWQKRIVVPVIALVGAAVGIGAGAAAAKRVFRGSGLGEALKFPEGWSEVFGEWTRDAARWGQGDSIVFEERRLQAFAEFVDRVADDEIKGQVEAMMCMSTIPLGTVAEAFVLDPGAKGGKLTLPNSGLDRKIQEIYGGTNQVNRVRGLLVQHQEALGDSMAHVFYLLAALNNPSDHALVEQARGTRSYDDIPPGPARDTYEKLAQQGLQLAKTTYADQNWFETVANFVSRADVLLDMAVQKVREFDYEDEGWSLAADHVDDSVIVSMRYWRRKWYQVPFSAEEFIEMTSEDIANTWLKKALEQKQDELRGHPPSDLTLRQDGMVAEYAYDPSLANTVARTPAYELLKTKKKTIYDKYKKWYDDRQNSVLKALTATDPLEY